jgi:hypothetical protein
MVTPVSCRQAKAKAGLDRVNAGNEDGRDVAGFVQSLAECGHIWRKRPERKRLPGDPIIGIAFCCAFTARAAAIVPPSANINSRRLTR